jgi:hypothetical protein
MYCVKPFSCKRVGEIFIVAFVPPSIIERTYMMKLMRIATSLLLLALVSAAGAGATYAASSTQVLFRGSDGSIDLRKSDVCASEDGQAFARKNGGACRKGDLAYINVAFDSDKAGDLAEKFCDFRKELPPESMDVYGVLCYLRLAPPSGTKAAATAN